MEKWKQIRNITGYSISNKGRVRNDETGNILRFLLHNGYHTVRIKDKRIRVHRLVADAFIPNPNNYPIVNHKDEIKTNNDVNNLEWCTQQYNCSYGTRNERIGKTLREQNHNGKKVCVDGVVYSSYTEAMRQTGLSGRPFGEKFTEYKGHKIKFID